FRSLIGRRPGGRRRGAGHCAVGGGRPIRLVFELRRRVRRSLRWARRGGRKRRRAGLQLLEGAAHALQAARPRRAEGADRGPEPPRQIGGGGGGGPRVEGGGPGGGGRGEGHARQAE